MFSQKKYLLIFTKESGLSPADAKALENLVKDKMNIELVTLRVDTNLKPIELLSL